MDLPENPSAGIPEPPERLLRLPEVMERVGLRRTAIYQRMREGRFPASRSLGPRCTVWVESEIDNWVQSVISGSLPAHQKWTILEVRIWALDGLKRADEWHARETCQNRLSGSCARLRFGSRNDRRWDGMKVSLARQLKDLEKENQRLRKAVSDYTLDALILKEVVEGTSIIRAIQRLLDHSKTEGTVR